MNLSLSITNFNRFDLTIESFAQVIDDPRIDDIVVLDDASTDGSYEKLVEHYKGIPKVRVIRQVQNRGMSLNKRDAIGYAKNEWVIIFDSDNIIGPDYLDAFEKHLALTMSGDEILEFDDPYEPVIYCPSWAKPSFNYISIEGDIIDSKNIAPMLGLKKDSDILNMCLNTCNYIVNKNFYLKTYQHNPVHIASDTIWHAYNHLKAGGSFYIVPGMHYFHRVHDGSGFMQDVNYNMAQSEKVRKMIMAL